MYLFPKYLPFVQLIISILLLFLQSTLRGGKRISYMGFMYRLSNTYPILVLWK